MKLDLEDAIESFKRQAAKKAAAGASEAGTHRKQVRHMRARETGGDSREGRERGGPPQCQCPREAEEGRSLSDSKGREDPATMTPSQVGLDPAPHVRTALQSHWDRVAGYAVEDPRAAVCHPAAPPWLNRFFAHHQQRAVARLLAGRPLGGLRALDVGCGSGRWTRWLAERGAVVTGVDPTAALLEVARREAPGLDFRRMSATALDSADESFDLALSVTVIQHLQPREQLLAIGELCRVVRPGGTVLVLDLIDAHDTGLLVHPRSPSDWIDCYARHGMRLRTWEGQEYVPLLRAAGWALHRLRPVRADAEVLQTTFFERERSGPLRRLAHAALWLLVGVSRPIEHLAEAVLPNGWARHGIFLFEKSQ